MTAVDERLAPVVVAEPTPHQEPRFPSSIERGWHVQVDGVWLLVERVDLDEKVRVTTATGETVTLPRTFRVPTRTPAEQFAYVASLFPSLGYYKPWGRRDAGPLANPFAGSGKTPLGVAQ